MTNAPRTLLMPVICCCAVLAACRSAPVHYHTLTPLADGPFVPAPQATSLVIERVTVPPQMDRTQIVVRQGPSGLAILETDWWGASLADDLQSALVDYLNRRPIAAARASLRVDVQRFDLVPGEYALLDVKWRLRTGAQEGGERIELSCQHISQAASGNSVDELVRAQQANVQKVALMISASGSGKCPS